jgi:hypothetical protein
MTFDPSQIPQINGSMPQTNKAIGGGPGIPGLKDVQLSGFSFQACAPLGGKPPSLASIFSSKKPPSAQRQVEEQAMSACKSGGEAYFRDIASTCVSVSPDQLFGRDMPRGGGAPMMSGLSSVLDI